ncbi:hypothetical protein [Paenibacillus sacheonensis]|uniref:hypothetical protein n=1 Tax=Paenibacillus sacheonensis TaxID=742054 RepID=UPI00308434CA|nr:hypothetical protein [Paenibacillus sacheonensis]
MKLVHFFDNGLSKLGVVTDRGVLDVAAASSAGDGIPVSVQEAIEGGAEALAALRRLANEADSACFRSEDDLKLGACVPAHRIS